MDRKSQRDERLARALRENLKRRKQQARQRAADSDSLPATGSADAAPPAATAPERED